MPGLLSHHLRDAHGLRFKSIPVSITPAASVSTALKRMPLGQITVRHGICDSAVAVLEDRNNSESISRLVVNYKEHGRLASYDLHSSAESEHDLAAMVHDFIENGSCGSDFLESSEGENGKSSGSKLFETLQALKSNSGPVEKEILNYLTALSRSTKEVDLVCSKKRTECNGGCIRRFLVKRLRLSGYDAAICSSKWSNSGKLFGGEYEYIDICFQGIENRLIVDVDFLSQFEIARPTHSYVAALKLLPVIFVGSVEKLEKILQVMAEATELSLRQNSMPLPPWRTLTYMTAKWMSPFERSSYDVDNLAYRNLPAHQWEECVRTKQCVEQLRHLKRCLAADAENLVPKPASSDRNGVKILPKTWRMNSDSSYL